MQYLHQQLLFQLLMQIFERFLKKNRYFISFLKYLWAVEKKFLIAIIFFLVTIPVSAQQNVTTVGFQFKPIFSSSMFGTGPVEVQQNNVSFLIHPKSGFSAGMLIRRGISQRISFEGGISYVKRNFDLTLTDGEFSDMTEFKIIGYEVPVTGLVYIPLSQHLFMNAAFGFSFDFFPSDIYTKREYFEHYGARREWVIPGMLANLGWELRTEKSGYFYLGASYHQPFDKIYNSIINYAQFGKYEDVNIPLKGNYLTFDIRYFFHEEPKEKVERKKKTKQKK